MKKFDPADVQRTLDGHLGLRHVFAMSYEKAAQVGASAHLARADISSALQCLLVGYDDAAHRILERVREGLTAAIMAKERAHDHVENATEAWRHFNLAFCNWLLTSREDGENSAAFLGHVQECVDRGIPLRAFARETPSFLCVGAVPLASKTFLASGARPLRSLGRIRSQRQMANVLCRYSLERVYSQQDVGSALRRFLDRAMNSWLLSGQYSNAAIWMKIVHFNGRAGQITAKDTVLKCYEY